MKTILRLCLITLVILCCTMSFSRKGKSIFYHLQWKLKRRVSQETVEKRLIPKAEISLKEALSAQDFDTLPDKMMILAFKQEQVLETYGWQENTWRLIKSYPFTETSGDLGPKLEQGDYQIPEGSYKIEYLNPNSRFHLSAKVSYPNRFDRQKGRLDKRSNLGGDIFIHGKDVSIGCIPIGDAAIEEVYAMLSWSFPKNTVKVIIAPWDFRVKPAFPDIKKITWEKELYQAISKDLNELPIYKPEEN